MLDELGRPCVFASDTKEVQPLAVVDREGGDPLVFRVWFLKGVEADGAEPVTLARGDAVVVPAAVGKFQVRPQWSVEFLKASVPGVTLPEPETRT